MVKLTEDMVVARSKGAELHNVKKLNCWGSELTNVSVVRKLTNVEVLSLSVNQISTLEDFQHCANLQELYIRKNLISDINEVLYLRNIPKLRSLWLADNPCAEFEQYRMTVLRALPHLQKLDNIAVESEEVQQSTVCGLALPLPDSNFRGVEPSDGNRANAVGEPVRTAMPRSNSAGESLRSDSQYGSRGSLSDSSPAGPTSHQQNQRNVAYNNQSLEEGYEYTQNVYDEDDEHPPMRRTSYSAAQDPEPSDRRLQSQSYPSQQNRGSRYFEQPGSYSYVDNEDDDRVSTSSGHLYPAPAHRRMSYGNGRPHPQIQSPPRRPSQAATSSEVEPPADRPYSRASADYTYDTRNANHVIREDPYPPSRYNNKDLPPPPSVINNSAPTSAVQQIIENNNNNIVRKQNFHRRSSREQYRESPWAADADSYNRDRAYSQPLEGYRQREGYAGRPTQEFRTAPGDTRHFTPRPSSVGEILQQHYDDTYRRVNQQIETASRVTGGNDKQSPTRPYPLRPKTRNANVLSAVLCLIKELDYSSLEVVEMAIRCRMEELDD